jgi:hypothetical protein
MALTKCYRLWNLETNKIILRRDVRFNETCFPFSTPAAGEASEPLVLLKPQSVWVPLPPDPLPAADQPDDPDVAPRTVDPLLAPPVELEVPPQLAAPQPDPHVGEPLERRQRPPRFQEQVWIGPSPVIEPVLPLPLADPAPPAVERPRRNPAPRESLHHRESDFSVRALLVEASRCPDEPRTYNQAISGVDSEQWIVSIGEELASHAAHGTWKLVPLPPGRRTIGHTWVFKHKLGKDGQIIRHKSRLCAIGYSQIPGVDFEETFAHTLSIKYVRTILIIAAAEDLTLRHLDVTTAFLYGTLPDDQQVYMSLFARLGR